MFQKGDPRINRIGRPRKTRDVLKATKDLLAEHGWSPAEALWKLYQTTDSDKIKKEILVALLPYCEGKMKEQDGTLGTTTTPEESKIAAEETMKLLKEMEKHAEQKPE